MKKYSQMSLLLSILLVLQFVLPTVSVFAAPLEAPNDVKIFVNSGNNLQIRWTAVSTAQSYNVYQISNGEKELISSPKYPYLNLANQPEGNYAFEVTAYNTAEGESPSSEVVEFILVYPEMSAPQDLNLLVRNGNDLFLQWSEVEFATGYNIYQVVNGGKELVKTTDRLNWNFSNLPAGDYVYEVHSVSSRFGESELASPIFYTLKHPEMLPPVELNLTVRNGNDLFLQWSEVEFATGYNIYRVVNGEKALVKTTDRLNWNFPNLPAGDYVYEVHSVSNRFGESALAGQISYALKHPEMLAPVELNLTVRNGNDLFLQWSEVEFATGYNIYQVANGKKTLIKTTDRLNWNFPNLPTGDYLYEVHSVSSRFGESALASQISYTLEHPEMMPPSGLDLTVRNGNDIFLRWSETEFATGYNIYQVANGEKELVKTTDRLNWYFTDLPAGEYVYEVNSFSDRFGESQAASQISHLLEHPEMQMPTDLSLSVQNGNDLLLRWAEVEFATGYNIYRINDGVKEFVMTTDRLNRVFTNMPEDWYEYEVTAVSTRFGESAPANAELTLGHPTVKSPELQLASFDEATAVLRWNEITNAAAYHVFEVIDGEYVLLESTDKISHTITDMNDGSHEYVVTVTHSRFGDSNYSNAVAVEMQNDLTPPVTSSNAITDWINKDFAVVLTAEDDKSGVDKTFYSLDGVDFLESANFIISESGSQKISFYSTDLAGNVEEAQTAQVNIDKTAPETSSNANSNWHQEFTVQLKAEDEQSGVKGTFYSLNGSEFTEGDSIVVNEEGVNTVSFYSTDVAGNEEEVKTAEVKIDRTAPETVSNADGEWHAEFAMEFTASDDKAGVETTFYSVDSAPFTEGSNVVITEDGVNTIEFYSVDKAGNTEAVETAEVNIDKSAPETVSNADSEWHQEFAMELTATDDKSAVAKTFYSINGSEFAEGSSFTVDQDGINEISFYSVNGAGGTEEVKTVEVKIDRKAPETESNESAEWKQEAVIEFSAIDTQSGLENTFYSVNGSEFVEGTTVTVTEAGVNQVSYYSTDKVGNKEDVKTIQVNIDGIAPETASNAVGEWFREFTVELIATDEQSGVATTFYSANGSEFVEGTSFAVTEEGINTISFYSVDKAGNIEEVKTAEVKIDRTVPETLSNIQDKWLQGEFVGELTATDEHSGVVQTFYSVDGSPFTEGTSFSVSEEGVHDVEFYSTDAAGNKEETNTAQVKIDKTAPDLAWDLDGEVALGSKLAVSYQASDALSGIASEKLTVNGKETANGDLVQFDQPGVYTIQVTVIDQAGWISTLEETITVYIPLHDFKVKPGIIKGNSGVFSVEVSLPAEFPTKDFVLETAAINGVSAITGKKGFEQQAQKGHFRFEREDFEWIDGEQLLEFRGMVGGYLVIGQAKVQTKSSNKK